MPVRDEKQSSTRQPSPKKRWGEVAVEKGFITPEQLQSALQEQQTDKIKGNLELIGAVLLRQKVMTREQVVAVDRALQGSSMLAGFEILEKVGQGGMGAVYRARQVSMDRIVALKILPRKMALDPNAKERFFREARLSANMNHLNLINGIDCGEAGGYTFFAMEFVEGETARKFLKRKGRLSQKQCVDIIQQIAHALDYAHSQKLVHRDVKPDNIMITPAGVAKLCDLGLTRSVENDSEDLSLTQTGRAVGTPYYISPEQARGKEVDARSDLYSLGATFYHLAAGRPPFEGTIAAVVMAKHLTETAPSLHHFHADLSENYVYIIAKMMAKSAADRYASAKDLLADLDAVARGKTPDAAGFRAVSSCPLPQTPGVISTTLNTAVKQPSTGFNTPVTALNSMSGRLATSQQISAIGQKIVTHQRALLGLVIGASLATLLLLGILMLRSGGNTPPPAPSNTSVPKPLTPPSVTVKTSEAQLPSPADLTPPAPKPENNFKITDPKPTLAQPIIAAVTTPPIPEIPIIPKEASQTPLAIAQPVPVEKVSTEIADTQKERFFAEMYTKTINLERAKATLLGRELREKPEYATIKTYSEEIVRELEKLVEFEQTLYVSIGKLKPQIELPKDHPFKSNTGKVSVKEFSEGHLQVSTGGVEIPLTLNSLPPKLVLELAQLKHYEVESANYLLMRGDGASTLVRIPSLPEAERNKLLEKIEKIKAGEPEFLAQDRYEAILSASKNSQWKDVLKKINTLAIEHGSSPLALDKSKALETLRDQALEMLYPIPALLKAKQCKVLEDGWVTAEYDFDAAEQLKDFECPHAKLLQENGRMKVPSGGGRFSLAAFKPRLLELKKLETVGKSLPNQPRRIGLLLLTPGQAASDQQPILVLHPKMTKAALVNWSNQINANPDANINSTANFANKNIVNGHEDISFKAEAEKGLLKWSVNNHEIGSVKIPDKMKVFQLSFCGTEGDHSWEGIKLTFKLDPEWIIEQRKKLAEQ